jgi:mannose-6-phosphate isomerase-like protein (cupin superfamily)
MHHARLNALPGDAPAGAPVFPGLAMASAWRELQYLVLPPGTRRAFPAAADREVGYLLLEGAVELAGSDLETQLEGPAALLCGVGWEHLLASAGKGPARLLRLSADLQGGTPAARAFLAEPVDPARLKWRPAIHGGAGQLATRHIWGPGDFSSPWVFLDHAVLAPGSSLGYHYHDALEECFIVLGGQGYLTLDGQTLAVGPGAVTWQGMGQAHGLYNFGDEPLDFLRAAVGIRGAPHTTVDLNDNLLDRKPSA